jgi:hypothetical protein
MEVTENGKGKMEIGKGRRQFSTVSAAIRGLSPFSIFPFPFSFLRTGCEFPPVL